VTTPSLFEVLREKAARRGRIELEPGDYSYSTPSWEDVQKLLDIAEAAEDFVEARHLGSLERLYKALRPLFSPLTLVCTGCIGTDNAETLVEDLTCPIHGIEAQAAAQTEFPDRQAWLDYLARDE